MNRIILGDCVEELSKLKDFSVDLVVADPPYWKVVNEKWDYQWKTEQEYIQWSITWIKEVARTLRYGGTFYLFGYFRTLAHLVPYFEELADNHSVKFNTDELKNEVNKAMASLTEIIEGGN